MAVLTELAKYYAWDRGDLSEQEVIEQIKSGELDGFENNGEWFVRYETAVTTPSIGMEKRGVRLIVGALMPVAVATGILIVLFFYTDSTEHINMGFVGFMLYLFLVLGYLYAGIASIIYTIVMEFVVNPLVSNHVVVIGISTVLGALAGSLAGSLVGALPGFGVGGLLAFLGLVPGFVTGLYLRWSYVKEANKLPQSDTTTAHLRQNVTNAPKWPDED